MIRSVACEISNSQLDDLIIRRTDGAPTYNFVVVVDDWDMGITQVIRGEDHINNTPRQINIYEALGAPVPMFAHCAMIMVMMVQNCLSVMVRYL